MRPILREGDRINECGVVEARDTGVTLSLPGGAQQSLAFPPDHEGISNRTLHLVSADLRQVLDVYQSIAQRTVICPTELPAARITLKTGADLSAEAALAPLDRALASAGLTIRPAGQKFVFVLDDPAKQRIATLRKPPAGESPIARMWRSCLRAFGGGKGPGVFPPGLIKFSAADCSQVLDIYRELSGRSITNATNLRAGKVTIRSQTPLTASEATWLIEAALAVEGIKIVLDGEKRAIAKPTEPPYGPQPRTN